MASRIPSTHRVCLRSPGFWALILALGFARCAAADQLVEWSGMTMGPITFKVIVVAGSENDTESAQVAVSSTLQRINERMSTYVGESEVSRFNRSIELDWFPVSEETARVVERSQAVSRASGGAFDVTVKPLVELWNFGPGRRTDFQPPSDAEVAAGLERIGWQKLQVRLQPPALRKSQPDLQIDLSAIAKGYAVDAVSQVLIEAGFANHFVEIGGEVVARGTKPGGTRWRIGIERPNDRGQSVERVIELENAAVATSGDYRNFAIRDGRRFSHEIDPATGRPSDQGIASASILANDCMTADALATAGMILDEAGTARLCREFSAEYFLLRRTDNGFVSLTSPGYPAALGAASGGNSEGSTILPVFLGALVLFLVAMGGLLVGVVFARRPLKGSCGGMSALTGDGQGGCGLCGGSVQACPADSTSSPDGHP